MAWIPEIGESVCHIASDWEFVVAARSRSAASGQIKLVGEDGRFFWLEDCAAIETEIKVGDFVTGVEGRDSHGWHGTVKKVEQNPFYYRVHWQEREKLGCSGGAILGMLPEQVKKTILRNI